MAGWLALIVNFYYAAALMSRITGFVRPSSIYLSV